MVIDECNVSLITQFLIDTTNSNIKMIINIIEKIKLSNMDIITLEKIQNLSNNISYISLLDFTNFIINHKLKEAIQIMFHSNVDSYSQIDLNKKRFVLNKFILFVLFQK